jgi:hypothetical protein
MIKCLVWTIALMTMVLGCTDTAKADTTTGYTSWVVPSGTVCVQTSNHIAATAAGYWSLMTDANLTARSRCTGFARNMIVGFKGSYDSAGKWCARFVGGGWTWMHVRGQWTWTPKAPTIEINLAPERIRLCRANNAMFMHVMVHELGHFLGLDHNDDASILCTIPAGCGWKYTKPQPPDVQRVNRKY